MRNYGKIIGLLLVIWSDLGIASKVDEDLLRRVAEDEGYGYKYANLSQLLVMVEEFNKNEKGLLRAAVPTFFGLSSPLMQKYLRSQLYGIDIEERWQSIIKTYFANTSIKELFAAKQFPKGFIDASEALAKDIKKVFTELAKSPEPQGLFTRSDAEKISVIKSANERVMVRSSGREDTKTLANAGGNESVSNVIPEFDDIYRSLGDVVASYFEARSLTQRLAAKDPTLLDPIPFTPVIIQRMIGEKKDTIPRCGVMFTEDAEGSVSRLSPQRSSGITLIQAAYGHNEAVVNSRIPVDSYYVDAALSIFPIVKMKSHRMQPALASGALDMVRNDMSMARMSALSKEETLFLKRLANKLEDFYSTPMDAEFVVNDESGGTVNLVQARPIVHRVDLPLPSYLRNPAQFQEDDTLKGQAIGVAGGSLRFIEKPTSIIVAATINDALGKYQNRDETPDPDVIEAIVVGQDAPATSHEATSFRSDGKPVVFVESYERIERWLSEGKKLVVSPQQGLVVNWRGDETKLGPILGNSDVALPGWESYPAPSSISLNHEFLPDKERLAELLSMTLKAKALGYSQRVTDDQITLLKIGKREQAEDALQYFRVAIFEALDRASIGVSMTEGRKRRIASLKTYVLALTDAVAKHLDIQETDAEYPRRLLPIRFFENVLLERVAPGTVQNATSVISLIGTELVTEQKIIKEFSGRHMSPLALTYLRAREYAMSPGLEQKWQDFVLKLEDHSGYDEVKRSFLSLMSKLAKLELIPVWLHTSFAQIHDDDPIVTAQRLIDEVSREEAFLNALAERRSELDALSIQSFANPKSFEAQWQTFSKTLLDYFTGSKFLETYHQATGFGKLAAVPAMAKMIDSLDQSIKALKGSRFFSDEAKTKNVNIMLHGYRNLLKAWFALVPKGAIVFNTMADGAAEKYFELIEQVLGRKSFTAADLDATQGFNATAFTIGSGLAIMSVYPYPTTLEDAFTVIHQSLLVVIGALNKEAGADKIGLPDLLQSVHGNIMTINRSRSSQMGGGMMLLGTTISPSEIELLYNFPLQNHSMQMSARYIKPTDSVEVGVRFFGHAAERWVNIGTYVELLMQLGKLRASKLKVRETGVEFVIALDKGDKLHDVFKVIQNCVNMTFGINEINMQELVAEVSQERLATVALAIIDRVGGSVINSMPWILDLTVETFDNEKGWRLATKILNNMVGIHGGSDRDYSLFKLFEMVVARPEGQPYFGAIATKLLSMWQNVKWDEPKKTRLLAIVHKLDKAVDDNAVSLMRRLESALHRAFSPAPMRIFHEKHENVQRKFFGSFLEQGARAVEVICRDDGPPCTLAVTDFHMNRSLSDRQIIAIRYLGFTHGFVVEKALADSMTMIASFRMRFDETLQQSVLDQIMQVFNETNFDDRYREFFTSLEREPEKIARFVQHIKNTIGFKAFEHNPELLAFMPILVGSTEGSTLIDDVLVQEVNPQHLLERIISKYNTGDRLSQTNVEALIDRIAKGSKDDPRHMTLKAYLIPQLLNNDTIRNADVIAANLLQEQIAIATMPKLIEVLNQSTLFNQKPEIGLTILRQIFSLAESIGLKKAATEAILSHHSLWRIQNAIMHGTPEQKILAMSLLRALIAIRPDGERLQEIMRWFISHKNEDDYKPIIQELIAIAKEKQYKDHMMTQDALRLLTEQ